MQTLFQRSKMGQPFGGLPASAYVPAAAILPTSNPQMFPMVSWPPGAVYPTPRVLVETVAPAPASGPSTTTIAILAGAGVLGLAVVALLGR